MFAKLFAFVALALLSLNSLAGQQGPQLYFFTNPGCGPCKQVEPDIRLLISKNYPVTIVDTTRNPEIAQQFRVVRTPTTILVADNQIAQRKEGLIDALQISQWFRSVPQQVSTKPQRGSNSRIGKPEKETLSNGIEPNDRLRSTLHKGTREPANQVEFEAMRATVRLKVEDPQGISFATGTVVHCSEGECLVVTCGHVFREAGFRGKITADVGFETHQTKNVPGRLIDYDSGSKDIALVVIKTGFDVPAVKIAPKSFRVSDGEQVFTLGCDHGEDATIRRTKIKRQALYSSNDTPDDKAKKYDIYGRPVDGRSGGGMFTAGGQLIGVCNAAAVEVDEGVYTALDNIYWQLAQTKLDHLFAPNRMLADERRPQIPRDDLRDLDRNRIFSSGDSIGRPGVPTRRVQALNENVGPTPISDTQVIIVLQSKSSPGQAETLIIDNPSDSLMDQIRAEKGNSPQPSNDRFARLREQMPRLDRPADNRQTLRAQSRR